MRPRSRLRNQLTKQASAPRTGDTGQAHKRWTLVVTSLGSLMVALDALVVATALGTIRRDLGASIETLQWIMGAYNLTFAVLLLTGAALGDRFGRRRVFTIGLAVFVAASAACAVARSASGLIAARVAQGAGAALVMSLAMALLGAAFEPPERARVLGVFGGITGIAMIAAPLLGGAIAAGASWHWIFWINVPIGLSVIALTSSRLRESRGERAGLDVAGVALVSGAAIGVAWGLIRGNSAGWSSREVLAALGAGATLAVAFTAWERRATAPMVPLRFFRSRSFSSSIAASFLFYGAMFGCMFFLPQFFQAAQGQDALGAGARLLPLTATLMVISPGAGAVASRIGERKLVVGGLLLMTAGLAWLSLTVSRDIAFSSLALPLVVVGVGVSMAIPAAQSCALSSVAPSDVGKASGIFNMARFLGGVFGVAVAVSFFARTGGFASPEAFCAGFAPALMVCAALALAGTGVGLGLRSRGEVTARGDSTPRGVAFVEPDEERAQ